jgi:hypothetical protein
VGYFSSRSLLVSPYRLVSLAIPAPTRTPFFGGFTAIPPPHP